MQIVRLSVVLILLQVKLYSHTNAQELRVGDQLGVKVLDRVLNVDGNRLDMTKAVFPLTIIDFWETNCSGCVKSFAKIDTIRKQFSGLVRILLVNRQTMDSTIRFFKARSKLNYPLLTFVTEDTILNKAFPHKGVPYCVWLDSNLRVIGFSRGSMVNERYIKLTLQGKNLIPSTKKSGHDKIQSILNYEYEEQIRYSSIITSCITGNMNSPPESFRKRMTGISKKGSIEALYKHAYFERRPEYLGEPIILFLSRDSVVSNVPNPYDEEWFNKYCYHYSLQIPQKMDNQKYTFMQKDLLRFFGHKVDFKKFPMKCIVLESIAKNKVCLSKGGKFKNTFFRNSVHRDVIDSVREIRNGDFVILLNILRLGFQEVKPGFLFVNKSGIKEGTKVDVKLSGLALESMDIELINRELAAFKLKISMQTREIEKIVVSDK